MSRGVKTKINSEQLNLSKTESKKTLLSKIRMRSHSFLQVCISPKGSAVWLDGHGSNVCH